MIFTSMFQMQCQSMSSHAYVMQCSCQTTDTPVECMPSIVTFMPCILSHLCNAHVFQCTFTLLPCTFMSCTSMPCTLSHECNAHYPMRSLMHVHAMHIMPFMPCTQCTFMHAHDAHVCNAHHTQTEKDTYLVHRYASSSICITMIMNRRRGRSKREKYVIQKHSRLGDRGLGIYKIYLFSIRYPITTPR